MEQELGGRAVIIAAAITTAIITALVASQVDWSREGMPPLPPLQGCYSRPDSPSIVFEDGKLTIKQHGSSARNYDYRWDDSGPLIFVEPPLKLAKLNGRYQFNDGSTGVLRKSKDGEQDTVTISNENGTPIPFEKQSDC